MARAPAARAAPFPASRRETAKETRGRGTAAAGEGFPPRAAHRSLRPAAIPAGAPRARAGRSAKNAQPERVSCPPEVRASNALHLVSVSPERITRGAPGVIGFSAKAQELLPVSSLRRVRRRQRALVSAPPAAPLSFARLWRHKHRLALGLACMLEPLPPLREFLGRLAARAPQDEEVESGPESFVSEESEGTAAAPLFEARLQGPDFLHHGGKAARDGELVGLDLEHGVHRLEQRRDRPQSPLLGLLPRREHFVPQQRGEQERRRHGLARAHPGVGLLEREADEALAHR